jgi:aromatic ring-opening dioxygenase catalytic subunit (LigB family)
MATELPAKPKAVLMVTAHWEENAFTVQGNVTPPMIYDYGGFPDFTYQIQYPARGDAGLAKQVFDMIKAAGLPAAIDPKRGFDHGTFTPMAVTYPNADMPIVQLSIHKSYDPAMHIDLGRVLAPLRHEGVLIVGSGLSYHNLRSFGPEAAKPSKEFDDWLHETLVLEPSERLTKLTGWERAPSARLAHPREDHLVPLFVALGAAEDGETKVVYHEEDFVGGLAVSSFRFD